MTTSWPTIQEASSLATVTVYCLYFYNAAGDISGLEPLSRLPYRKELFALSLMFVHIGILH